MPGRDQKQASPAVPKEECDHSWEGPPRKAGLVAELGLPHQEAGRGQSLCGVPGDWGFRG